MITASTFNLLKKSKEEYPHAVSSGFELIHVKLLSIAN